MLGIIQLNKYQLKDSGILKNNNNDKYIFCMRLCTFIFMHANTNVLRNKKIFIEHNFVNLNT